MTQVVLPPSSPLLVTTAGRPLDTETLTEVELYLIIEEINERKLTIRIKSFFLSDLLVHPYNRQIHGHANSSTNENQFPR